MERTYTVSASGPLAKKAGVILALQKSGIAEVFELPEPSHGLPVVKKDGWVTFYCDADQAFQDAREVVMKNGWRVRLHAATPPCSICSGHGKNHLGGPCVHCNGTGRRVHPKPPVQFGDPLAELRDLKARIAALEGKVS